MKHLFLAVLAALWLAYTAHADERHHTPTQVAAVSQAAPMNEGEVRKIDKSANKITIKHGPLAKLDMPAMTMVFQVKDPTMLERVKAGDKIKFDVEKVGATYIVTKIEAAQ
jgi:Cu/Ag efflux protein CusF